MSQRDSRIRRRQLTVERLEARTLLASVAPPVDTPPAGTPPVALVASADLGVSLALAGDSLAFQDDVYRLNLSTTGQLPLNLTLDIDWGDGRRDQFSEIRSSFFHSYAAPAKHVINVSLVDANQQTLTVANHPVEVLSAVNELVDPQKSTGLQAELFNTPIPTGSPILTRIDPVVDFDFGLEGPDPRTTLSDSFSIRWTGTLTPVQSGYYRLFVISGATDGVKLTIGSSVAIDTLSEPTGAAQSVSIQLAANQSIPLTLEYHAGTGPSKISLQWMPSTSYRSVIPDAMLNPPAMATASGVSGVTGALLERFDNVSATSLTSLRRDARWVANQPSSSAKLAGTWLTVYSAATPSSQAGRIRGMLVAPATGLYRFAFFGTGLAELRLSSSSLFTDQDLIVSLTELTTTGQPGPTSDAISLREGERYAFEIVFLFAPHEIQNRVDLMWSVPSASGNTKLVRVPVTSIVTPVPLVTVTAGISQSNESPLFGRGGSFTLERSDDLGRALRVHYVVGGTATNGVDYRRLSGNATFLRGQKTVQIAIRSFSDAVFEGSETVVIRLLSTPDYQLGNESERQITVTIQGEVPATPSNFLMPLQRQVNTGDATFTSVNVQDPNVPATAATRVTVNSSLNDYDVSMRWQVAGAIATGDSILVSFYARVIQSPLPHGVLTTRLQLANSPFVGSQETFDISNQWQQYVFAFRAVRNYASGAASFDLRFGFLQQTIEVANIQVFNLQKTIPATQLPRNVHSYDGRDAESRWRQAAEINTKTFRNDSLVVQLPGVPPGSHVTIKQLDSEFRLGTAAAATWIAPTAGANYLSPAAKRYRSLILELFNTVTDDGSQQWGPWLENKLAAEELAQWAINNELSLRGHSTLWGDIDGFPTPIDVRDQYDALLGSQGQAAATNYLETQLNQWVSTGSHHQLSQLRPNNLPQLTDLDVENHPLLFSDFSDLLGQAYIDQAIAQIRQLSQSETKLYINEGQVLSQEFGGFADPFFELLSGYLTREVPIDGAGFQGHFNSKHLPSVDYVLSQLERFGSLDLDLQVTEFDIDQRFIDKQTQADFTRDFFRSVYSNPDVNTVVMWGFWQGEHWRAAENAGLFDSGFNIKPNGQAFVDFQQFSPVQLLVNQRGEIETTLPRGRYQLQIELPGGIATTTVDVQSGGTLLQWPLPAVSIASNSVTATMGSTATNRLTFTAPPGYSLPAGATVTSSLGSVQAISEDNEYLWQFPVRTIRTSTPVQLLIQYPTGTKITIEFTLTTIPRATVLSNPLQTLSDGF